MLLLNARSIVNKFDEFLLLVSHLKPGLMCVTESWLHADIDDNFLCIDDYYLLRVDRVGRRGGSVCAWVRACFGPKIITPCTVRPSFMECIIFTISSPNVIVILLYIPPGLLCTEHKEVWNFVSIEIEYHLSRNPNQNIFVCGDFNDFPTHKFAEDFNFTNFVLSPTRKDSVLDQFWIDERTSNFYQYAEIGAPLGNSDHNTVILNPINHGDRSFSNDRVVPVWDYRDSNVCNFVTCLASLDFSVLDQASNVDHMCEIFYSMLNDALSKIPFKLIRMSKRDKVWMTPVLKVLITKRWEAYRKRDWERYSHYKDKVKKEIVTAKKLWARKQIKSNKNVWNVVNEVRNRRLNTGTVSLQDDLGGVDKLINELTKVFDRNFNSSDDVPLDFISRQDFLLEFSEYAVYKKLLRLKRTKSSGPDDIAPRLVKEGAAWLCVPLCKIFNRSISEQTFPTAFKVAKVVPIPKKSQPTINDFRAISLLPSFSKILEQLVLDHLRLDLLSLYGKRQHAFRPLGSTTSALVDIVDSISASIDSRETSAVHATCLDLTKAFDMLQHNRLVNQLNKNGIDKGFLLWLISYLKNRFQYVSMDGKIGSPILVRSGVPQGSTLGPYLFAAFIGSLAATHKDQNIIMYADDLTIVENVGLNFVSCVPEVLSTISNLGLLVNAEKCGVLCIPKSRNHSCSSKELKYKLKPHVKILGFLLNNKLTWDEQITSVVSRASKRLHVIRVLKPIVSTSELKIVYHALITSLMTYGSPVYGQLSRKLLSRLEKLQKRAHRIICGAKCLCPDFVTMEQRFRDAISKFLLNCEKCPSHPLHDRVPTKSVRNFYVLPHFRTEKRLKTFFPYATRLHNKMI